ncbi:MAG: hypothetical protein P4N60_04705 [Verrucomicrobiae bacterium]|nr:hypothetical protein [Verrucomicrobiae bacterium]
MIPREILKKIRQIEIRPNRIMGEFAVGARALARFTARTTLASKSDLALNSIDQLKRRDRRAPAALTRGCVQIPTGLRVSPEGCQKLAGGRSASADPRYADKTDTTLKGSQPCLSKWAQTGLAPLQGAHISPAATGGVVALRAPQPPANFSHAFSVPAQPFVIRHSSFSTT